MVDTYSQIKHLNLIKFLDEKYPDNHIISTLSMLGIDISNLPKPKTFMRCVKAMLYLVDYLRDVFGINVSYVLIERYVNYLKNILTKYSTKINFSSLVLAAATIHEVFGSELPITIKLLSTLLGVSETSIRSCKKRLKDFECMSG